jgi:SAM-dependent methyltransferase
MKHTAAHHQAFPWWLGYLLLCPVRRWFSNPAHLLTPYVREGMTVLEPGPGMGFFTLDLARMVGTSGRVIAVDIQPRMIAGLKSRAAKAGLLDRIDARLTQPQSMGLNGLAGAVDFVLAFAVVHELPDAAAFFAQAAHAMKPGARMLVAEPPGPVSVEQFGSELNAAATAGLAIVDRPRIGRYRTAVLKKN